MMKSSEGNASDMSGVFSARLTLNLQATAQLAIASVDVHR